MCLRTLGRTIAAVGILVLTLIPAAAKPDPKPEKPRKDYQASADALPWAYSVKAASAAHSASAVAKPYEAEVLPGNGNSAIIRVKKFGKTLLDWEGHTETVFVIAGDAFYVTGQHQYSSGCQVVAVDLTTGKQLWKTALKGLGPIAHTRYRNHVNIALDDAETLRIFGRESAGGYVEFVDRMSGKTVGNHRYKAEVLQDK